MAGGGGGDFPIGLAILAGIGGLLILACGIGALVGQVRCTNVPEESGAKGFAVGAIICIVINFVTGVIGGAMQNQAVNSLGNLVSIIGSILFVLFIRQSARYLGDSQLASSASSFLIFGVVMVGMMIGVIVAAVAQIAVVAGILGFGMVIGFLVGFFWYLRLIKGLIGTIDQRS
jgi:hypothetical protein